MVSNGRNESNWRPYIKAARTGLIAAATILVSAASNPPSPGSGIGNNPKQPSSQDHTENAQTSEQGTTNNPLIVQVIATTQGNPKAAQPANENSDESANWWLVRLTFGLIVVGLIQAGVFWIQAIRLRQSIIKMDEIAVGQTEQMTLSITEAANAAKAMKEVADSIAVSTGITSRMAEDQRKFWKMQMRAYLSVGYGEIAP